MIEVLVKIEKSKAKHKKYVAIVRNKETKKERKINFGDNRYENFKDSTPLGLYTHKNHGDKKRRDNYFSRHSGTKNKQEALLKEMKKSGGKFNAKILSHRYLW